MNTRLLQAVALRFFGAVLISVLVACHTMRAVQPSQIGSMSFPRVWVTLIDSSSFVLARPSLRGDTLTGFVDGAYREMPVSDARSMRALEPARLRTALLAGGASVALLGAFAYFQNRSYVGPGEACGTDVMQEQQVDLHCGGPCPC